jgi:hypothetical protein
MGDEHQPDVPLNIEQVVAGLSELGTVLGPAAGAALPVVGDRLRRAMAARDRGDPVQALDHIAAAMTILAEAAEKLDRPEAVLMRTVLERFRASLQRWDEAGAKRVADAMFERSGARWRKS